MLDLCRWLYNTALEQRITAYQRRASHSHAINRKPNSRTSVLRFLSTLPSTRHVLQDVLARLDKTYQAFFRRLTGG